MVGPHPTGGVEAVTRAAAIPAERMAIIQVGFAIFSSGVHEPHSARAATSECD